MIGPSTHGVGAHLLNFACESGISDQSSSTGFECVHCWNLTRAPSGFGFRIDSFYLGNQFSAHRALLGVKVDFGEALNVGVEVERKLDCGGESREAEAVGVDAGNAYVIV